MAEEPVNTGAPESAGQPDHTAAQTVEEPQSRWLGLLKDAASILALPALLLVVFTWVLGMGSVQGESMAPLFDDYTIVITCRLTSPGHQDIVMIHSSALGEEIIKRVIGLPGDTVEVRDGRAWRNGQPLDEDYVAFPGGPDLAEVTVPEHTLFVLGDNRAVSLDSRSSALGFVPEEEVDGVMLFHCQAPKFLVDLFYKIRGDA